MTLAFMRAPCLFAFVLLAGCTAPNGSQCQTAPCASGGKSYETCGTPGSTAVKYTYGNDSCSCSTPADCTACSSKVAQFCGLPGSGGSGGSGGGGAGGSGGPGGPTVNGPSGQLVFGVFGDARPANIPSTPSDVSGYPTQILTSIFDLAQKKGAKFMVGTGDYMFADSQAAVDAQLGAFTQAHAGFSGPLYLAMGNHECNGYTDSNCPNFNEYPNVRSFMKQLPSGVSSPYYRLDVDTPMGKAKFLFVAANAWSTAQETWLQQQLADPTTYTLVVRHEPATGSHGTAPGVQPSESLLTGGAAYTLELLGHTHTYRHSDLQHVISGNAGAPISGGTHYGFLLVEQGADGKLTATEYDQATGTATDTWTISPDGKSS